jgi:hypothetical protein
VDKGLADARGNGAALLTPFRFSLFVGVNIEHSVVNPLAKELGKEGGAMDEHGFARTLGWWSIGVGLAAVATPRPLMNALGLSDHPTLGRLLGVRDLVIGTGLLLGGQNTAVWCRARGIVDALDGALILVGAATGAFRRDRAPIGVASGAGSSALSSWLARRLEQQ